MFFKGKNILVGGDNKGNITLYDIEAQNIIGAITKAHESAIYTICELPDFRIATGSFDDKIKIWDLESSSCVQTYSEHYNFISKLLFVKEEFLVSGAHDCRVKMWNTTKQTEKSVFTAEVQTKVVDLGYNYHNNQLIVAGNLLSCWDFAKDTPTTVFSEAQNRRYSSRQYGIRCLTVDNLNRNFFAVGSDTYSRNSRTTSQFLGLYDTRTFRTVAFAHAEGGGAIDTCMSVIIDGNYCVCGDKNGVVVIFDIRNIQKPVQKKKKKKIQIFKKPDPIVQKEGSDEGTISTNEVNDDLMTFLGEKEGGGEEEEEEEEEEGEDQPVQFIGQGRTKSMQPLKVVYQKKIHTDWIRRVIKYSDNQYITSSDDNRVMLISTLENDDDERRGFDEKELTQKVEHRNDITYSLLSLGFSEKEKMERRFGLVQENENFNLVLHFDNTTIHIFEYFLESSTTKEVVKKKVNENDEDPEPRELTFDDVSVSTDEEIVLQLLFGMDVHKLDYLDLFSFFSTTKMYHCCSVIISLIKKLLNIEEITQLFFKSVEKFMPKKKLEFGNEVQKWLFSHLVTHVKEVLENADCTLLLKHCDYLESLTQFDVKQMELLKLEFDVKTDEDHSDFGKLFSSLCKGLYRMKHQTNFILTTKDGGRFHVHKEILIMKSNFLFQLFNFPGIESFAKYELEIEYFSKDELAKLIEFIYTDGITGNIDNLDIFIKLFNHSDQYFEVNLKYYLFEKLEEILNVKKRKFGHVVKIFESVSERYYDRLAVNISRLFKVSRSGFDDMLLENSQRYKDWKAETNDEEVEEEEVEEEDDDDILPDPRCSSESFEEV